MQTKAEATRLILNTAQAEAAINAMMALNNVNGNIGEIKLPGLISITTRSDHFIAVTDIANCRLEVYGGQNAFIGAYGKLIETGKAV